MILEYGGRSVGEVNYKLQNYGNYGESLRYGLTEWCCHNTNVSQHQMTKMSLNSLLLMNKNFYEFATSIENYKNIEDLYVRTKIIFYDNFSTICPTELWFLLRFNAKGSNSRQIWYWYFLDTTFGDRTTLKSFSTHFRVNNNNFCGKQFACNFNIRQ